MTQIIPANHTALTWFFSRIIKRFAKLQQFFVTKTVFASLYAEEIHIFDSVSGMLVAGCFVMSAKIVNFVAHLVKKKHQLRQPFII